MRVTIKGQITVPQALRERYGLQPGTEVEFVAASNGLLIRRRERTSQPGRACDDWLLKAAGSARTDLSTDEIMKMSRGED